MADPDKPSNQPVDLSSLEGLTLGTAWTPGSTEAAADGHRTDDRDRTRSFRTPFKGHRSEDRGPRFNRDDRRERPAPIEPPSIKVVFYPEEAPFKALTKAIKASKRTYELFEISRLILEKPERTAVTVSPLASSDGKTANIFISIVDGAAFMTETEALDHAAVSALDKFFKVEEVQIEAPKGNYTVIHRCGITGKLIAPPNYHRYAQILNKHISQHLPNMALPAVQARLESVKEPEIIAQWVESMKMVRRYTLLVQSAPLPKEKTPAAAEEPTKPSTDSPASSQPADAAPELPAFDGEDAAIAYLKANHRNNLIKTASQARLSVKQLEALPSGEVKRSIDAARAMQMKFPLDTANTIRGRLRRMGFCLYKQGPKGVSFLTAVKRKFRIVGQNFAPEVQQVIECIERNPHIQDSDLPKQVLGITVLAKTADGATTPALSAEEESAVKKLRQTLQWLVEEGYVIHYGNGKLFIPAARQPNAIKKDEEEEVAEEPASNEAPTAIVTPEATPTEANSTNLPIQESPSQPAAPTDTKAE